MRQVQIENKTRPLKKPLTAGYAAAFLPKLRGLAWQRSLAEDRGLVLVENSESRLGTGIHMLGMAFNLTIVWLDANLRVVDVAEARRGFNFLLPRKPARYVIECAPSRYVDFKIGDQLTFQDQ